MKKPLTLVYYIQHSGEPGAGIRSFTDEVTVTVASGDPGNQDGEFADFVRDMLLEWFDGAGVSQPIVRGENKPDKNFIV